jgi:integrase
MAKSDIWKRPGTTTWYANVWDPARKVKIKKKAGTRRHADALAAQIRTELNLGKLGIATKAPTLDEFTPRFMREHVNPLAYRGHVERYLKRFRAWSGNVRLTQITNGLLSRYRGMRESEKILSPFRGELANSKRATEWRKNTARTVQSSSVNREISVIRCMLACAVEWGILPLHPAPRFKRRSEKARTRKRHLIDDELHHFLDALKTLKLEGSRLALRLLLFIGRRRTEVLSLRVENYDRRNGYVFFEKTKEGSPDWIPIPRLACEILDAAADRAKEMGCPWLFPNPKGTGPSRDVRTAFKNVVARAGLANFKLHDLRHTAISIMVMSGMDFATIAALVGHTSPSMVEKVYGHLSPRHKEASAVLYGKHLERLIGKSDGTVNGTVVPVERPIALRVAEMAA